MESTSAKLARAVEHFESFNVEAQSFAQSVKHEIVLKWNPATGEKWLVLWDSDHFPSMRLSAIVGDVLFNLRSALDNVVCGLVRRADSAATCETLQFPICTSEKAFENALARGQLEDVPDDARRFIKGVQPMWSPENNRPLHPLSLVHDLNNRDKHRAVHMTIGFTRGAELVLVDSSERAVYHERVPDRLTDFGPTHVSLPSSLPNDLKIRGGGRSVIMFRGEPHLEERAVGDVLATCIRFVETDVLFPMKRFFEPRPQPH